MEHVPQWAHSSPSQHGGTETRYYAPQYASDAEWYENTVFPGERGAIDEESCYSRNQSWPCGQWLNAPYPVEPQYFIVDDVINERGAEGFEVMFGNPYTAIGTSCEKFRLMREALAYVEKHLTSGEVAYRVKLARRHGSHKITIIKGV
jgi:hypothetical protein